MFRKSFFIMILFCCIGLILMGCPKKTVVKEEPSMKQEEAATAKREEAAKAEAERAAREREQREAKRKRERTLPGKN